MTLTWHSVCASVMAVRNAVKVQGSSKPRKEENLTRMAGIKNQRQRLCSANAISAMALFSSNSGKVSGGFSYRWNAKKTQLNWSVVTPEDPDCEWGSVSTNDEMLQVGAGKTCTCAACGVKCVSTARLPHSSSPTWGSPSPPALKLPGQGCVWQHSLTWASCSVSL